ncbi:MAG: hypothetical protein RLZZ450_3491 [Pseudomonadota bacterium]|jgi:dolichyl-phosphate beta-glucosyltransferase
MEFDNSTLPPRGGADAPDIRLTVVIPVFNEQERLGDSLYAVKAYLSRQDFRSELLIIDDGSSDLTVEVVRSIDIWHREIHEQEETKIVIGARNIGKGHAVARGLSLARGRYVLCLDADMSTPVEDVERLLPYFDIGYGLVIGSRALPASNPEIKPLVRRVLSRAFRLLTQSLVVPGIQDTQCGFKAYTREAAHSLARYQSLVGFAFDVEHLYLAKRLGIPIKEVPVRWSHREGSKVSLFRDSFRMAFDIARIRFVHRGLRPAGKAVLHGKPLMSSCEPQPPSCTKKSTRRFRSRP